MYKRRLLLLNIKPNEAGIVKKLFLVQFFLGVATAFLFTGSLTLFISNYKIQALPEVFIASAILLLLFNSVYARLEARFSSTRLLQGVILFSAISIVCFWIGLTFFPFQRLPFLLSSWYMLLYMLVGYAFWGMAAVLFNVRESKRIFSIVGAGDIPAKMLGYFSVTALVPLTGINNLLWISVGSFIIAFLLLKRFKRKGFAQEQHHDEDPAKEHTAGFIETVLQNRLVLFIAILTLLSFIVFAFIDYTFLSDIKVKYREGHQLATFIAVFFAVGRLLSAAIKLLFSSRMISRIGLTNALLVTPVLLLLINCTIIITGNNFSSELYLFGLMVLLTEILRSTLQEPVFFILFQPLSPHERLKGHLIAKGYTIPFALIGVGTFLIFYLQKHSDISILLVAQILVVFLLLWIATVLLIRKAYMHTLQRSLKKGYFTGTELFLTGETVNTLLLQKAESQKPMEVIHALNLLERSNYGHTYNILLKNLQSPSMEIKEYVLSRIIDNNMKSALPFIKQQLADNADDRLQPKLLKAFFYLDDDEINRQEYLMLSFDGENKKAAMVGLLYRRNPAIEQMVLKELLAMAEGDNSENKILATEIIMETRHVDVIHILEILLRDKDPLTYKKAIEASGKIKAFRLFDIVLEVTERHKSYPAFQQALVHYGDDIFNEAYLHPLHAGDELLVAIIKTAGKIRGRNSTAFLVKQLKEGGTYTDHVIEAAWMKKAGLHNDVLLLVAEWAHKKSTRSGIKISYYHQLSGNPGLQLLRDALKSEIQQDLNQLLKAYALLYDRQKMDRVIELLSLGNASRMANAVEVLELILPNRDFIGINNMVELLQDIRKNQVLHFTGKTNPAHILDDMLGQNKAGCGSWTRSVACYLLPALKKNEFSLAVLYTMTPGKDRLLNETRNHVLSILK